LPEETHLAMEEETILLREACGTMDEVRFHAVEG
jgi:hypothetical protein